MSSKPEHPIQAMGFWVFGFLSVVLAVLKLTVAGYWSWWRVMLPLLAFLGHNAVHLLTGFLCFCWLKHEEDEEEPSVAFLKFLYYCDSSGRVKAADVRSRNTKATCDTAH